MATWNWALIFGILWGLDNVMAQIPAIKANNIFQLITQLLSNFAPKP